MTALVAIVSITVLLAICLLGSFSVAKKALAQPLVNEDERCHELSGMDRCELELEHEGPHRKTERATGAAIWWEDTHTRWQAAKDRADELAEIRAAQLEGNAKLALDKARAAPEMHPEEHTAFLKAGFLKEPGV